MDPEKIMTGISKEIDVTLESNGKSKNSRGETDT